VSACSIRSTGRGVPMRNQTEAGQTSGASTIVKEFPVNQQPATSPAAAPYAAANVDASSTGTPPTSSSKRWIPPGDALLPGRNAHLPTAPAAMLFRISVEASATASASSLSLWPHQGPQAPRRMSTIGRYYGDIGGGGGTNTTFSELALPRSQVAVELVRRAVGPDPSATAAVANNHRLRHRRLHKGPISTARPHRAGRHRPAPKAECGSGRTADPGTHFRSGAIGQQMISAWASNRRSNGAVAGSVPGGCSPLPSSSLSGPPVSVICRGSAVLPPSSLRCVTCVPPDPCRCLAMSRRCSSRPCRAGTERSRRTGSAFAPGPQERYPLHAGVLLIPPVRRHPDLGLRDRFPALSQRPHFGSRTPLNSQQLIFAGLAVALAVASRSWVRMAGRGIATLAVAEDPTLGVALWCAVWRVRHVVDISPWRPVWRRRPVRGSASHIVEMTFDHFNAVPPLLAGFDGPARHAGRRNRALPGAVSSMDWVVRSGRPQRFAGIHRGGRPWLCFFRPRSLQPERRDAPLSRRRRRCRASPGPAVLANTPPLVHVGRSRNRG